MSRCDLNRLCLSSRDWCASSYIHLDQDHLNEDRADTRVYTDCTSIFPPPHRPYIFKRCQSILPLLSSAMVLIMILILRPASLLYS
jgi:hypothetical protein